MAVSRKTALAAFDLIDAANAVIACQKGLAARAQSRPRDKLIPKDYLNDATLLAEFHKGWDFADEALKAE